MCKEVEKVLEKDIKADVMSCTVLMDGEEFTSDDFVAVLSREDGSASFYYNTDAITLGMAMKMAAKAFVDSMSKLPDEEREMVTAVLGEGFSTETQGVAEDE